MESSSENKRISEALTSGVPGTNQAGDTTAMPIDPASFASVYAAAANAIQASESVGNSTTQNDTALPSIAPNMAPLQATAPPGLAPLLPLATPTDPQQQLFWQQALQSLAGVNFITSQQAQQAFLAGAAGSNLAALYPAAAAIAQAAPVAPAPQLAAAPQNGKRKATNDAHASRKTSKTESVVSSSNGTAAGSALNDEVQPPKLKDQTELDRMTPAERRRYERNMREQQRSYRISQQIKQLRDVLAEASVPFKPNKFAILVSVVDYIKQLQSRAIMLDVEHQRLVDTIRETNELVTSGQVPATVSSEGDGKEPSSIISDTDTNPDLLLVQGLDYMGVVNDSLYPLGVASLDGRILAYSRSFEELFGCPKDELLQQSLFVHIRNHQEVFEAMADLLKRASISTETGEATLKPQQSILYWCGQVVSAQNANFPFTITLTSAADGNPKYFSFSASPSS